MFIPARQVFKHIQSIGNQSYQLQIDIVADISNDLPSVFEGRLKFVVAMRFENGDGEGSKVGLWVKEREIYDRAMSISPNEKQAFKLENFDLTELLNAKRDGRYLNALLFKVLVLDSRGIEITRKEKELSVTLGD